MLSIACSDRILRYFVITWIPLNSLVVAFPAFLPISRVSQAPSVPEMNEETHFELSCQGSPGC